MRIPMAAILPPLLLLWSCGPGTDGSTDRRTTVMDASEMDFATNVGEEEAGNDGVDNPFGGDGAPVSTATRASVSQTSKETVPSTSETGRFSCDDGKRVCREMSSCAEAEYHLHQCGVSRLDGDGDGVPCERICGH